MITHQTQQLGPAPWQLLIVKAEVVPHELPAAWVASWQQTVFLAFEVSNSTQSIISSIE